MNNVKISKYLCMILRHRPSAALIELDEHGWANVDELLRGVHRRFPNFDRNMLEEIVACDDKQRYAFDETHTRIRANQGHSIKVEVGLQEKTPTDVLWHGSATRFVRSICQSGLIPMSRLYVHLSKDIETAVKVGKRHGEPVVFAVDTKAMVKDGYHFYLSANGVWLTKEVPYRYLTRIKSLTISECSFIIERKRDSHEKKR